MGSGLLGTGGYLRSGQLRERGTTRLARTLIACAVVGTPLGVLANAHVSGPLFGALLGVCVMAVGALLYVRVRRPGPVSDPPRRCPGAGCRESAPPSPWSAACSASVDRC